MRCEIADGGLIAGYQGTSINTGLLPGYRVGMGGVYRGYKLESLVNSRNR